MKTIYSFFCAGLMAVGLMFTGCSTTCDGLGESEYCPIHHELMHEETVDNNRHWRPVSQQYVMDRLHNFPHSYPFVLPEKCDKCLVYICDDCVRAEEQWKMQHPGGQ